MRLRTAPCFLAAAIRGEKSAYLVTGVAGLCGAAAFTDSTVGCFSVFVRRVLVTCFLASRDGLGRMGRQRPSCSNPPPQQPELHRAAQSPAGPALNGPSNGDPPPAGQRLTSGLNLPSFHLKSPPPYPVAFHPCKKVGFPPVYNLPLAALRSPCSSLLSGLNQPSSFNMSS